MVAHVSRIGQNTYDETSFQAKMPCNETPAHAMMQRTMVVDFDKMGAGDPGRVKDEELSLLALKGKAVSTLQDVLLTADSDDVKRKAAVDILNFNREGSVAAPTVTNEQLEYLGRVIVEAETVRVRDLGREEEPRLLESSSTH